MNKMQFIFDKIVSNQTKKSGLQNPYIKGAEGRAEWNDRYMMMKQAIHRWQQAFLMAMVVIIIFSIVIAKIAAESKVQPFVVETTNGMPYAIKSMQALSIRDQRLINFAINQFIVNARTIISDAEAEKNMLNKVYAYSANNTIDFMHHYFEKNNPFNVGPQYTVTVNIVNSLPMSQDTWQVTWDETKRSTASGTISSVTRWMANVTYKFGDVNSRFINENPFGFYVTDVSWAQNRTE